MSIANQIINLTQQNLIVRNQIVDSKQKFLTMTANSEQHKLSNKCFGTPCYVIYLHPNCPGFGAALC